MLPWSWYEVRVAAETRQVSPGRGPFSASVQIHTLQARKLRCGRPHVSGWEILGGRGALQIQEINAHTKSHLTLRISSK